MKNDAKEGSGAERNDFCAEIGNRKGGKNGQNGTKMSKGTSQTTSGEQERESEEKEHHFV